MRHKPYRQAVGSLLYLSRVSWPDISFAVNQLARHCATPRREAWMAVKHLLSYLQHTKDLELVLKPVDDEFRVATNGDWANDKQDRKSVSGFAAFLFGCPIHWASTKQSVIALSRTTAEFIAANDGLQQAEWIQLALDEILAGAEPKLTLLVDNQSTIHRIKREGSSNAQNAIDVRFHALKDAWRDDRMALEYVPTSENLADLLTKAFGRHELLSKRSLRGLASSVLGDDQGAAV